MDDTPEVSATPEEGAQTEVLEQSEEQTEAQTEETTPEETPEEGTPESESAAAERLRVKLEGEEVELDRDEVVRGYQLAKVSQKRFEEAAQMRKEATAFVDKLRQDPLAVLRDPRLGIDLKEVVQQALTEQKEFEQMTPEQRALREKEHRLAEKERQIQLQEQQRQAETLEREQAAYAQSFMEDLEKTLEKSKMPKTTAMVSRMAYAKLNLLGTDYDPQLHEILPDVRDGFRGEYREYLESFEGDQLLEELGEDVAKKVQKALLKKHRAASAGQTAGPDQIEIEPLVKNPRPRYRPKNVESKIDEILTKKFGKQYTG